MSAPLVVNTLDGTVWTRREGMRGGEALYAPEMCGQCPQFVMATLTELAEHGIAGSADVLPVPVGPEPRLMPERLAEIRDLIHTESSIAFYSHRAKESILLLVTEAEDAARLRVQVAELGQQLAAKDRTVDEDPIAFEVIGDVIATPHAFEREYQGESDAKRRLPNCMVCGRPAIDSAHDEDVTPKVAQLRALIAGQRDAAAAEAGDAR